MGRIIRKNVFVGVTMARMDVASMRFHTAGDAKSPVYDCLVPLPYDDTSIENSLRA